MNEHVKNAIEYAFRDNVAEMQSEIVDSLMDKVGEALAQKRIEVAQSVMVPEAKDLPGNQEVLDVDKDGKIESSDLKKLRNKKIKESEELEEKLSVSDGADAWISDFVHSDDPKFEGKSKKERIQMALGAFYSAKKGKTRNEEAEGLDELSTSTLGNYFQKSLHQTMYGSKNRTPGMQKAYKKMTTKKPDAPVQASTETPDQEDK